MRIAPALTLVAALFTGAAHADTVRVAAPEAADTLRSKGMEPAAR